MGQLTHLNCGAYHFCLTKAQSNRLGERPGAAKSFCMEKKKLDYFRKRLESRQQDLRRMVSRTQQDGRTVDEDSAQDIADRAASSYTKEFLFHQSNNDRQLLQMVEGALDRIREGNFGECISCCEFGSERFFGVFLFSNEINSCAAGGALTFLSRIISLALSFWP